jgi:integrase/recombinase XerD
MAPASPRGHGSTRPTDWDSRPHAQWTAAELNQLLGCASRLPEGHCHSPQAVDGIPARLWWTAFLLTALDTGHFAGQLLTLAPEAFDAQRGTLRCAAEQYQLDGLTVSALVRLPRVAHAVPRLFPWRLDGFAGELRLRSRGRLPIRHMLTRAFRYLLFRAWLPHGGRNLFERLSLSAESARLLPLLRFDAGAPPREGKPSLRPSRATGAKPGGRPKPPLAPSGLPLVVLRAAPGESLRTLFDARYCALKDLSSSYISDVHSVLRQFTAFLGHEATPCELSDELIESFMVWRRRVGGASPMTVNGDRGVLLALWNFAWRKRLVQELPRDVPKVPVLKRRPRAWRVEQMGQILTAAHRCEGHVCGVPASIYWPALILCLYDTGLRVGALLSIRAAHVDLANCWLDVDAEDQKQGADQGLALHPLTAELIAASGLDSRGVLFPYTTRKRLNSDLAEILGRAGLPNGSGDLFHKFRRTHATHVADVLGDEFARDQLGHSSVEITRRSYIDRSVLHRAALVPLKMPRPEWRAGA